MIKKNGGMPQENSAVEKYSNLDYVERMFEEGNQEEIDKIQQLHNLSSEQISLFCEFAVLRKQTLNLLKQTLTERKNNSPEASEEELEMGAYIEQIEPQVRDAVLRLRQKGYNTYESGFGAFDSQKISFLEESLSGFSFPESLNSEMEEEGVELIVTPKSIELKFSKFKNIESIKALWQKVEESLPSLNKKADPCIVGSAKLFREKQIWAKEKLCKK